MDDRKGKDGVVLGERKGNGCVGVEVASKLANTARIQYDP